jgi:hypothetical protein
MLHVCAGPQVAIETVGVPRSAPRRRAVAYALCQESVAERRYEHVARISSSESLAAAVELASSGSKLLVWFDVVSSATLDLATVQRLCYHINPADPIDVVTTYADDAEPALVDCLEGALEFESDPVDLGPETGLADTHADDLQEVTELYLRARFNHLRRILMRV